MFLLLEKAMLNLFSLCLVQVCAHNYIELSYIPLVYRGDQVLNGPRLCSRTLQKKTFHTTNNLSCPYLSLSWCCFLRPEGQSSIQSSVCDTSGIYTISLYFFSAVSPLISVFIQK